jgi:hypothetical protein
MTRKEYNEKQDKYNAAVKEIRQKQIDLDKAYADDLAKLNGLEVGEFIRDRYGVLYAFSKIEVTSGSQFVWGRKIKKDGTPSCNYQIIWGYKLKEE